MSYVFHLVSNPQTKGSLKANNGSRVLVLPRVLTRGVINLVAEHIVQESWGVYEVVFVES